MTPLGFAATFFATALVIVAGVMVAVIGYCECLQPWLVR